MHCRARVKNRPARQPDSAEAFCQIDVCARVRLAQIFMAPIVITWHRHA
jgi:hypothetical protein